MGVEKIKAAFKNGKKAFIPYVMGGDGGLEKLKERIRFLDEAGASIVEIGIPFSDPVADGPVMALPQQLVEYSGSGRITGGPIIDQRQFPVDQIQPPPEYELADQRRCEPEAESGRRQQRLALDRVVRGQEQIIGEG